MKTLLSRNNVKTSRRQLKSRSKFDNLRIRWTILHNLLSQYSQSVLNLNNKLRTSTRKVMLRENEAIISKQQHCIHRHQPFFRAISKLYLTAALLTISLDSLTWRSRTTQQRFKLNPKMRLRIITKVFLLTEGETMIQRLKASLRPSDQSHLKLTFSTTEGLRIESNVILIMQ